MEPEQLAFRIIPKDAAKHILPGFQKMIDDARKHVQNRSGIETIFGGLVLTPKQSSMFTTKRRAKIGVRTSAFTPRRYKS